MGIPVDVMYYYELKEGESMIPLRCLWVKHCVGNNGDTSKACFGQIGTKVPKELYYESLRGESIFQEALYFFGKKKLFNQIKVAGVMQDEGELAYIDKISLQKEAKEWAKKVPRRRVINTNNPALVLNKVGRTTQYLGDGEGILFPTPEVPANLIVLSPDDRIENTVVASYAMGNGDEDFVIPEKEKGDFRLQLPNGFCIYLHSDGTLILQLQDVDPTAEPTEVDANKEGMQFLPSIGGSTSQFAVRLDTSNWMSMQNGEYGLKMFSDGLISLWGDKGILMTIETAEPLTTKIEIDNDTENITVQSNNGDVLINTGSAKNVTINSGTEAVSLTGHTHPFSGHTHTVPAAIPGPPQTTTPASPNIQGETDKHSKHLRCVEE